ncbi:MAG: hypothetical protein H6661_10255 [Ardenticatenaceae bacterium]|nr:hypothetical protein [Ardenticatenaceae bacterium]
MWLATKFGFFSVVAHRDDPDLVLVRGRSRDDLEQLRGFAEGRDVDVPEIVTSLWGDYCCRIFMPRAAWEHLGAALTADIDYPNFKQQVHGDPERDAAYMQMWSIMRRFQEQKLGTGYYCEEHRYNPPPNSGMAFCPMCELDDPADEDGEEWDEDEVFDFLDTLRDSGVVNMFGARPYLQETFGFDQDTAADWLTRWMESYGSRHGLEES